jgi:energy-coupling factor transporter ATP-binding protein EcfA2
MDEPTVGLDPFRREALWRLFSDISKSGSTIFVTTHHVNEASRADLIGMMRGGRILVQVSQHLRVSQSQIQQFQHCFLLIVYLFFSHNRDFFCLFCFVLFIWFGVLRLHPQLS